MRQCRGDQSGRHLNQVVFSFMFCQLCHKVDLTEVKCQCALLLVVFHSIPLTLFSSQVVCGRLVRFVQRSVVNPLGYGLREEDRAVPGLMVCCVVENSGIGMTKEVVGLKDDQSEFAKQCRFENVQKKPSEFIGFAIELLKDVSCCLKGDQFEFVVWRNWWRSSKFFRQDSFEQCFVEQIIETPATPLAKMTVEVSKMETQAKNIEVPKITVQVANMHVQYVMSTVEVVRSGIIKETAKDLFSMRRSTRTPSISSCRRFSA